MLSSAALQKLERYAQIALAKCGVSATLAHAATEATASISLSPFVSSSYDNFSLSAAVEQQQQQHHHNNNNSITNYNKGGAAKEEGKEDAKDKGALNRSVLLSADLWQQVAQQLTSHNTAKIADFATIPTASADAAAANITTVTSSAAVSTVSDGFVIAIALTLSMVQWEVEHYLTGKISSASASNAEARLNHHMCILNSIVDVLTAMGRDRAVESPSLTLAVATLVSVSVNATLSNLLSSLDALADGKEPQSEPSFSPASVAARLTTTLLKITTLASHQLRRAGAAYPLPKLFTIRVAAQQLKQLGSGYINAIKDTSDASSARMGAVGKMRLLQRFGLLYGVIREYVTAKAQHETRAINKNNNSTNINKTLTIKVDASIAAAEACKEAIIDAATPYVCTRTSRYHIYFRTEADESRLAMSGCTDIPTQVAPIDFVLTPPVDPEAITTMRRMQQSPAAKAAISVTLQSWAGATELIFIAFCRDGSWSVFAADARRRILAEQAAKKSRANKKALKDEEKEIQRQMKQKAVEALLKAREEEHKELMRLQKAENAASNKKSGEVDSDKGEEDDNDDAKSVASSAASSAASGLSAQTGKSAQTATTMSKAESDVRSVMSAASFQSYSTFLSVVDSEAIANEQRMQHESVDGNTNLPVIFLEMACLALHQFLESVGGSGNNAFIVRPETTAEGESSSGAPTNGEALSILPLAVVESVWSSISGMFTAFAAFIDAQPRTGLICFSLSEDVQYNKGLGYQSLGLLFARILVPALLKERACSGSTENAELAASIEALHVSQTLMIYERVASQAINQNLAAVLDMCCSALTQQQQQGESDAVKTTSKSKSKNSNLSDSSSSAAAQTATQHILQSLLVTIVSRLGQTNQLGLLLQAIITDHDAELRKRQAEAEALKKLKDDDDEDDEDLDDEESAARAAAKAKAEAVDREMALRRTVLPFESSLRLLSTQSFRRAFCESVKRSLDPEGLLETLGDALAAQLLGIGEEDSEGDDANAKKEAEEDDNAEDGSEDPNVRSFRSMVHLRAPVLLGAASLVFEGLVPTSLVAFNIFEKCAEIEAYLLMFLEGSLYPTLLRAAKEDNDEVDEETPSSNAFTLKYLLQSVVPSFVDNMRVKPTHLKRLFLCVTETLAVLRDTMYNVCLKDLGVDQLEKVVEVMNESLWQISALTVPPAIEDGLEEDVSEDLSQPRFIAYEKDSNLTLNNLLEHCVVADATRSPISGVTAMKVFVRLAAQRLQLVSSVGKLIQGGGKVAGTSTVDDEEATPAFSAVVKALGVFVAQHIATALEGSTDGNNKPIGHTRITAEEWATVVRTIGAKRWRKYLKTAADELTASLSSSPVALAVIQNNLPSELVTVLPAAASVVEDADAAMEDAASGRTASSVEAKWAPARATWRSVGSVPNWQEVIPALVSAIPSEVKASSKAKKCAAKASSSSSSATATPVASVVYSPSAMILQESLRLCSAAQIAFASVSSATVGVFSTIVDDAVMESIITLAAASIAEASVNKTEERGQRAGSFTSTLLAQLVAIATSIAPTGANAPSVTFLTKLYTYFTARVPSSATSEEKDEATGAVLTALLESLPYLLPSGAVTNAHLAEPLKAFISLGKALLKSVGGNGTLSNDEDSAKGWISCVCYMLSKHLPTYCDAKDLSKLASKALFSRCDRLVDALTQLSASGSGAVDRLNASEWLLLGHLVAASYTKKEKETEAEDQTNTAEDEDASYSLLKSLLSVFETAAAKKSSINKGTPFLLIAGIGSPSDRTLWALIASQLLRNVSSSTSLSIAHNGKTENGATAGSKKPSTTTTTPSVPERLAAAIVSAVEASLLQSVRSIGVGASYSTISASSAALTSVLDDLEVLSTTQRVRFSTFAPVVVAVVSKVSTYVASIVTAITTGSVARSFVNTQVVSRTLEIARLPLPALMGDVGHQDAVLGLLLTLSSPLIAKVLQSPNVLSSIMLTLTAFATHRPIVLARRASLLPTLLASLLSSIFALLNLTMNTSMSVSTSSVALSETASANLLNAYNSTLAVVVRQCEFEGSVASSTTPLSTGPATSPKSYVCCAIATAIFGVVNSSSHLGLFARFSNELDYLAKDLVVEMLKGRLPATAQRRLVDVTVKRDNAAEKAEKAKLKAKQQQQRQGEKLGEESQALDGVEERETRLGKKTARSGNDDEDDGAREDTKERLEDHDSSSSDDTDDEQAAAIAVSASAAGKLAPLSARKRYIIKRRRRETAAIRNMSESSFADLCYAALSTNSCNDAQNLLKQEILRIRDEDGRAIFRPTN